MSATSGAIISAARDNDLRERFIALAAAEGIEAPQSFVEARLHILAAAPADADGATIAGVYEYAAATYEAAPRPGENPAAVTDAHIRYALSQVAPTSA